MNSHAEIFAPGEFLKEELEERNWSQTEFAEIIGRPSRLVNEIIAGKRAITPETALQLAESLGTSAELWMNLQNQYDLSLVRTKDGLIGRKAALHDRFPVREMIKRKWIEPSTDIDVLEHQFRRFFNLDDLSAAPALRHAAKKTAYHSVTILQWSWLFRVKQIAESFVVPEFNKKRLVEAIEKLRPLLSAAEEARHVPRILNEAGVRFVLVEALPGSKIDGACLWLNAKQPVIALSSRHDRIDNFWFVLRHELEHLLHEHGKDDFVIFDEDILDSQQSTAIEESIANAAASQFAVNDSELESYLARVNPYYFSKQKVLGFSHRLGVHPGIVVGRLQRHLDKLNYPEPYRYLREFLVKMRHIVSKSAPTDGWRNVYPLT